MSREMPKRRDISVPKVEIHAEDPEGAAVATSKSTPGTVTVMGFDKGDVLLRTDKANTIQVRDSAGLIMALLVRLKGDVWGFSRRGDPDWEQNLAIYGNSDQR